MQLFDIAAHKSALDSKIKSHIQSSSNSGILGIIQVGENDASEKYINLKQTYCEQNGIPCHVHKIPADFSDLKILKECEILFDTTDYTSFIVQLPLPRQSLYSLLDLIPIEKNIDCLGNTSCTFRSPIIRSFSDFLYDCGNVQTITVIGGGALVGQPLAAYSKSLNKEVKVLNDYKTGTKVEADVVILSAGIPCLVSGTDLVENCNVVDFGSSVVDGKTVGDLDMKSDISHLGLLSPSPGGMGPLVVRYLVMNHLRI